MLNNEKWIFNINIFYFLTLIFLTFVPRILCSKINNYLFFEKEIKVQPRQTGYLFRQSEINYLNKTFLDFSKLLHSFVDGRKRYATSKQERWLAKKRQIARKLKKNWELSMERLHICFNVFFDDQTIKFLMLRMFFFKDI